jgi:hypothetical protein
VAADDVARLREMALWYRENDATRPEWRNQQFRAYSALELAKRESR